jgi:flagellar hook-length control protein FliK
MQSRQPQRPVDAAGNLSPNDAAPTHSAQDKGPKPQQGTSSGSDGQAKPAEASNGNGEASETQASDKGQTKHPAKAKDTSQDQPDDDSAAAMATQLQAYVNRGLDVAQAQADAAGSKSAKSAGLAKALLDGQRRAVTQADDVSNKLDTKNLIEELSASRQGLPAGLAEAERQKGLRFADLVDGKLQELNVAARQAIALPTGPRVESAKSAAVDAGKMSSTIFQPVGGDGWDGALGHQVVMMVSNGQQDVELQLNPPHLGPLDIKLSLNQDQASLTFVAANAPVREALQASLPRLNEMLAESGIQLAQANVQARTQDGGDSQARDEGGRRGARGRGEQGGAVDEVGSVAAARRTRVMGGLPGNVNLFV